MFPSIPFGAALAAMAVASAGAALAQAAPAYQPPPPQLATSTRTADDVKIALPDGSKWDTFHGQLSAQKYSPLKQIDASNVANLRKVWEFHTGDMSDGSGEIPESVWSATPIFANQTLYVSTPFYRVFAFDPATGDVNRHFPSGLPLDFKIA